MASITSPNTTNIPKTTAVDQFSELTFEQAYDQLGAVLEQLERGDLSLDESMALYASGRLLSKRCEALLAVAELRITQLAEED